MSLIAIRKDQTKGLYVVEKKRETRDGRFAVIVQLLVVLLLAKRRLEEIPRKLENNEKSSCNKNNKELAFFYHPILGSHRTIWFKAIGDVAAWAKGI